MNCVEFIINELLTLFGFNIFTEFIVSEANLKSLNEKDMIKLT